MRGWFVRIWVKGNKRLLKGNKPMLKGNKPHSKGNKSHMKGNIRNPQSETYIPPLIPKERKREHGPWIVAFHFNHFIFVSFDVIN